jgi:hypothetical protein
MFESATNITIRGMFWSAEAVVLYSGLVEADSAPGSQLYDLALHARTLFVDATARAVPGFDRAYLPGTLLALCQAQSVQVQPVPGQLYQWVREPGTSPAVPDTLAETQAQLAAGEISLLLLQADPDAPTSQPLVCIGGDICLDVLTPQDRAFQRLYRALDLQETDPDGVRWKARVHSSGLSLHGQAALPWEAERVTASFRLAQELPLSSPPAFRLTIEVEELTTTERNRLINSWRRLSTYINPRNPLTGGSTLPTPTWATLEIADPLAVPDIYWALAGWVPEPDALPLFFRRRAINLLLSDQQLYDTAHPPSSLAQIIPQARIRRETGALVIDLSVGGGGESEPRLDYAWQRTGGEGVSFAGLNVAFQPVETPEMLRTFQGLPTPDWFPGAPQPVDPALVWGFMPLEDGWAQLPVPNLTPQIYLDTGLANVADDDSNTATPPALLQGAVSLGNGSAYVPDTQPTEQVWSATLTNCRQISGQWRLAAVGSGYQPDSAALTVYQPDLILNGLFWLSSGAPRVEDALPDLDDWLGGLRSVPLTTFDQARDLFPALVTFALADFAFTLRPAGESPASALLTNWSMTYLVDQPLLGEFITQGVLPPLLSEDGGLFASYPPLVWRRHPALPMIQALPLTQSKSPPNYPAASRQLVPFALPVQASGRPAAWRFGLTGASGADSWPRLLSPAAPAPEWQSLYDLPLVALSLPGLLLDPQAASGGLDADPGTGLPVQYRFDLPYTDEINALAQLPRVERDPEEVSPLPDSPPPEPPEPLTRDAYADHWRSLSERASLASADAVAVFFRQGEPGSLQQVITNLIEPFIWPVSAQAGLANYPGSLSIDNASGQPAPLLLQTESALRGISGDFAREGGDRLTRLENASSATNPFHVEAGSMAAYPETNGTTAYRDQRGLLRQASRSAANLLRTSVALHRAPGDTASYELVSALLPVDLRLGDARWSFWFRDLPVTADVFDRAAAQSPRAQDINDPEALSREYNFRSGYEWRLGESGQAEPYLLVFGLHFYPLALERVAFIGDDIGVVEVAGRLQLPLAGVAEQVDFSNAVRLIFAPDTGGELAFSNITLESSLGEWPLALSSGEASDAPRLLWRSIRLETSSEGNQRIIISRLLFNYFLFDVEWTLELDTLSFPDPQPLVYEFEFDESQPLYPRQVEITLDLNAPDYAHQASLGLVTQLGRRVIDALQARYLFREGSNPALVADTAESPAPLHLTIANPAAVRWLRGGGLGLDAPVSIASGAATRLIQAVQDSREFSVELWLRPAATSTPPRPVLMLRAGSASALFSLTQGDGYSIRLLDSASGQSLTLDLPGTVQTGELQHVVFTRDSWGQARLYVDDQAQSAMLPAVFDGWNTSAALSLGGNWTGEYHTVAFYSRALSGIEVAQRRGAGVDAAPRTAFYAEVSFPLLGDQPPGLDDAWLLDDFPLLAEETSLIYADQALQFNWDHFVLDDHSSLPYLLPGMRLEDNSAPGFAFGLFDVVNTFRAAPALAGQLTPGPVSPGIQQMFERNGWVVTGGAQVEASGDEWLIRDGRTIYSLWQTPDALNVYTGIPRLALRAAFVETLLDCRWGHFLQDAPDEDTDLAEQVFGSSAGDLSFSYAAQWNGQTWEEAFSLNGFAEIKNLISWPLDMPYDEEGSLLTLPAITPDTPLRHLRHTIRVLFNQHEIPPSLPVVGEGALVFNLAHNRPWQFLAVVEHQLVDVTPGEEAITVENDRRWTALQEVRLAAPTTFRRFVEQHAGAAVIDPIRGRSDWNEAAANVLQITNGADDVNQDGPTFASSLRDLWIGDGETSNSYTGLRFNNVQVPRGARILSAYLEFWIDNAGQAARVRIDVRIRADAQDNSPPFALGAGLPSRRTLTSATVRHVSDARWPQKAWFRFNEMAPVIQEVINRPGWQAGNSLSVVLRGGSTTPNQRRVITSFERAPAFAPRLIIIYARQQGFNQGYFDPQVRDWLAAGDLPELRRFESPALMVEASAPHWISQTPVTTASATTLQYLPGGNQLAILSNPGDYVPGTPEDPRWLLLVMPFIGRLQSADGDVYQPANPAGPLQVDPIRYLQAGGDMSPLARALTNRGGAEAAALEISYFDTPVGRMWTRLDANTLEENWFRVQNPPSEPPVVRGQPDAPISSALRSVITALPNTPARLSRSAALRRAFDSFRRFYPPDGADEPVPADITDPALIWRQHSLLLMQGLTRRDEDLPLYQWHLAGLQLHRSRLGERGGLRRFPAATLIPTRAAVDGESNPMPVSFAISPYLGLGFAPVAGAQINPLLVSAELLCVDRTTGTLLPVASSLWDLGSAEQQDATLNLRSITWGRETHLRLAPDSPVAVLRFRQINQVGDTSVLTTRFDFRIITDLTRPVRLPRRVFRLRSAIAELRFRQGQYGGYEMPAAPRLFELAAPLTTGVQPLYLTEAPPGENPVTWPWGLSALRLSVQYTEGQEGVAGNIARSGDEDSNYTLWWQSAQYAVQFRSAISSDSPTAGLPALFRAPAIKSLLPVLPAPPMPGFVPGEMVAAEGAYDPWQPVLPGGLRTLILGARPGAMFVFRSQLLTQSALAVDDDSPQRGSTLVSGSVPVQHRSPRPVPLPPNTRPESALQTWASYFAPGQNLLARTAPVDEAFFAAWEIVDPARQTAPPNEDDPNPNIFAARRLLMKLLSPANGAALPGWDGTLQFEINTESPADNIGAEWVIKRAELVANNVALRAYTADLSPVTLFTLFLEAYRDDLNALTISDLLREDFADAGYALSPNATALVVKAGEDWRVIDGERVYSLTASNQELRVSHNLYTFVPQGDPITISREIARLLMLYVQVQPTRSSDDFAQTLSFALHVGDDRALPLPLEPYYIHFEDPEYNRQLASSAAHAAQNIQEKVGDQTVLRTVTLAADRKEYNPDSVIALRYDWDDDRSDSTSLQIRRIAAGGVAFALQLGDSATTTMQAGRLLTFPLLNLKRPGDPNPADEGRPVLNDGDKLELKITVKGKAIVLELDIVAASVTPVPEAAYALLRAQNLSDQPVVECVRFAWSPEATRVDLVCANDLRTEVVRRRAVFHWRDSARPGRDTRHALQKITLTGSTHFPALGTE